MPRRPSQTYRQWSNSAECSNEPRSKKEAASNLEKSMTDYPSNHHDPEGHNKARNPPCSIGIKLTSPPFDKGGVGGFFIRR